MSDYYEQLKQTVAQTPSYWDNLLSEVVNPTPISEEKPKKEEIPEPPKKDDIKEFGQNFITLINASIEEALKNKGLPVAETKKEEPKTEEFQEQSQDEISQELKGVFSKIFGKFKRKNKQNMVK